MGRFDEEGPSGLYDREREGRPKKITEEVEEENETLLEGNPTDEGENATRPATDRIADYLDRELGVDIDPETVRDALSSLGYSWTRPRRKLPPVDPEAYRERIPAIVVAVGRLVPMEDFWRELKELVAACLERSLEAPLESCRQYFDNLSGEKTLRTAGAYLKPTYFCHSTIFTILLSSLQCQSTTLVIRM